MIFASLYRQVFVFWCFKSVRCVEFCLSEVFKYRASALKHLLQVTRDNLGKQQTPPATKLHQPTFHDTQKSSSWMCGGPCWHWMAYAGACLCLMVSFSVWCCLEMWGRCLMSFPKVIRVLFMDVLWVPLRVTHASGQSETESRPRPKGAKQDWIGD